MSKCKSGYYYCYTDKKCKPISKGMKVTARFSGGGKEPEEVGIDKPLNGNDTNGNGNGNGNSNGGKWRSVVKEHSINGLRDPNQKMVKVVGSTSSQVGLAPVINQEREHQNVFPRQNEQA